MTETNITQIKEGDGRHARSERTRMALASALLALLEEGHVRPSTKEIAQRAGVSTRALFRHFDTLESLQEQVAQLQIEKVSRELPPVLTRGSLADRIDALVEHSACRNELITPVRRAVLLAHPMPKISKDRLLWARSVVRKQVQFVFETELAAVSPEERRDKITALRSLLSFSYWNALRDHESQSREAATRVLRSAVAAMIGATPKA